MLKRTYTSLAALGHSLTTCHAGLTGTTHQLEHRTDLGLSTESGKRSNIKLLERIFV